MSEMNVLRHDPAVRVEVTDHARVRARQRFPGFKAARIIDEVREALCEGRIAPGGEEGLLHAWTADHAHVYALRVKPEVLLVVTSMNEWQRRW